ncbi:hypothetical protein FPQ18DRAFT_305395 [Pyronema domesticum]|uniref:Uncharacterized protein n=1 Tax=Pyronema omphalodes (strain CBS 100304) TaxID=1076935 RepID=U4LFK2_PYROM|nr:hypothetical protein FPQ18DRAFT_305395 [Pyronema domesticum]CCX30879.1 Protein of unknown function [Pyronema omphalodes CBS 100304]
MASHPPTALSRSHEDPPPSYEDSEDEGLGAPPTYEDSASEKRSRSQRTSPPPSYQEPSSTPSRKTRSTRTNRIRRRARRHKTPNESNPAMHNDAPDSCNPTHRYRPQAQSASTSTTASITGNSQSRDAPQGPWQTPDDDDEWYTPPGAENRIDYIDPATGKLKYPHCWPDFKSSEHPDNFRHMFTLVLVIITVTIPLMLLLYLAWDNFRNTLVNDPDPLKAPYNDEDDYVYDKLS